MDLNSVQLTGRLGRDAELKQTQGGESFAVFALAVSGFKKDETNWFEVTLWGKSATSIHPYLVKGKSVAVQGRLKNESWEKDGVKRTATKIVASQVYLLAGEKASPRGETAAATEYPANDVCPF